MNGLFQGMGTLATPALIRTYRVYVGDGYCVKHGEIYKVLHVAELRPNHSPDGTKEECLVQDVTMRKRVKIFSCVISTRAACIRAVFSIFYTFEIPFTFLSVGTDRT